MKNQTKMCVILWFRPAKVTSVTSQLRKTDAESGPSEPSQNDNVYCNIIPSVSKPKTQLPTSSNF